MKAIHGYELTKDIEPSFSCWPRFTTGQLGAGVHHHSVTGVAEPSLSALIAHVHRSHGSPRGSRQNEIKPSAGRLRPRIQWWPTVHRISISTLYSQRATKTVWI